jgi:hypothetical protein
MTVRTIQRKRKQAGFPKPDLYFGDIPHWKMERIAEFERDLMRKALGEPTSRLNNKVEGANAVSESREPAVAE